MEVRDIKEKLSWENFLSDCQEKTFLQSFNWGEFQKMMGSKIWRLGVYDNNDLASLVLVVKIEAKRGTFLFLPHGPSIKEQKTINKKQILEVLLRRLKNVAKEEKVSFIRIGPIWERNEENVRLFKDLGFRGAPIHIHPELTWELDITLPPEELLMNMRKTTRYLIRQGLKNDDIKIIQSKNPSDIEIFNNLYQEVVRRHHFVPFPFNYLENEFSVFSPDDQILIF